MMLSSRSIVFVFLLSIHLFSNSLVAREVVQEPAQAGTTVTNVKTSTGTKIETGSQDTSDSVASARTAQVDKLLERLAINQGKGQFVQQKHFSFMSVPITSTGQFIVKDQSALWQTQQPVFSALLLTPDAIYRRLSLDENYQLLTDSAEFSGVLSTIFTGKVNADDWLVNSSVDDSCLELTPKSGQLKQLFQQVDLCLINEVAVSQSAEQAINNSPQQRQITLTDSKGDKTVIMMTLSNDLFLPSDFEALKRTSSQLGSVNDS